MLTRFSDIAGHEQSLRVLRRSLAGRRLHHSLIFHGPEAVGKRTVALALAAALSCEQEGEEACGRCIACAKVEKGIHPDVSYVTLERTVIPIDAIRGLRREAARRPFEGRFRVFIVDPADRLSAEAQNALLKTLEEPSPSSCIILITSRLMHLLPTTRSRCQSLAFGTLSAPDLARRLAACHGMPEAAAQRAARLSGGRYGAALALDLQRHDAAREALLDVLERLAQSRSRAHVLEDAEAFGDDAEEISARLGMLAGLVRDMMVLSAGAPPEGLINADRRPQLEGLAATFAARLDALMERVRLAASDVERNVNRRLLVESLMMDLGDGLADG